MSNFIQKKLCNKCNRKTDHLFFDDPSTRHSGCGYESLIEEEK